jgi:hypothetical protein
MIPSLKVRLGWHFQERANAQETQATLAASCISIRECICLHMYCTHNSGNTINVLSTNKQICQPNVHFIALQKEAMS